jgi:phosphomannomutase
MIFLFDVDGTLAPARQSMPSEFKDFFTQWIASQQLYGNEVYLVTGSDKDKTIEQVGEALWKKVDGSYQNCGNQLYIKGELIKEFSWRLPDDLMWDIINILSKSPWYRGARGNVEMRIGMLNISTVGRRCSDLERAKYYKWDKENGERESIASQLKKRYPKIEFSIGGEISIDIYPEGRNKSQVLSDMNGDTTFFGDRCGEGGNDYHLANGCTRCYNVKGGWKETMSILKDTN